MLEFYHVILVYDNNITYPIEYDDDNNNNNMTIAEYTAILSFIVRRRSGYAK